MPALPRVLRAYGRDAAGAFGLAPLEIVLGLVVAATFSVMIREEEAEWWVRVVTSAGLALPLLLGLSVLRWREVITDSARWGVAAAVVVGAVVHGLWLFDPDREADGWRVAALLGAAVFALSLVPVVGMPRGPRRRLALWHFNFLLLARIVTVVGYGAALYAALAGAVAAVSSLFELKTPEELYGDLAGWIFFALVPWVVVGGIPEVTEEAEEENVRRGVRLLGRYFYFPVLTLYLAILLAYAVKVLVTGEIPKNVLSPIVLLAGLFGFLGSVLLEPLGRHPEHPGVARLIRFFPLLLLPLLPLAAWALWERLDQHGWTEFRYLRSVVLAALGVLAVLGTVRLARRRSPVLVTVPAVLGAALLLASVGPWSATAVSRRSQQALLREGLRQAGLLTGGGVVKLRPAPRPPTDSVVVPPAPMVSREIPPPAEPPGRLVAKEVFDRIRGSTRYLYDAHGPESLEGIFGEDVARYGSGWTLAEAIPIRAGCDPREERYVPLALAGDSAVRVPAGMLYHFEAVRRDPPLPRPTGTPEPLRVEIEGGGLIAHFGGATPWTGRSDLRRLLAGVEARAARECDETGGAPGWNLSADEARFPLVGPDGRPRGELIVQSASIRRPKGSRPGLLLESASGLLIVKE